MTRERGVVAWGMPAAATPPPLRCRVDAEPSRFRSPCAQRIAGHCACWDAGAGRCCHCFADSWDVDLRPSRPTYLSSVTRWVRSAPETPRDLVLMFGGTTALLLVAAISITTVVAIVARVVAYFWHFFGP